MVNSRDRSSGWRGSGISRYTVDVAEMKTVTTVEGYNAVIIGAPMYIGSIVQGAGKFVGQYRDQLTKLPVAAFAVGMAPASNDAKKVEESMKALHASLAPLKPLPATMFAGKTGSNKALVYPEKDD